MLTNLAKVALAATLIWYVVSKVGLETIVQSLSGIERGGWALGLVLVLAANVLAMLRWHMLMRSVGLNSTVWLALRLGFLGVFFNNVVPGLTGGDLVKAVYVTRENPSQRAAAVVSVIVDRGIGIVALALIAAVVIPFDLERYGGAALGIYGFLSVAAVGAVFTMSRRMKARLAARMGAGSPGGGGTLGGLRSKLSGLVSKLDQAVSMYRHRLPTLVLAVAMSITVHMLIIVALSLFGVALSEGGLAALEQGQVVQGVEDPELRLAQLQTFQELGLDVYCSVVPIIMIISALPIAPAGWGVGEVAFVHFFGTVGIVDVDSTALSFTYRLTAMLVSLLGGIFFVIDRRRVLEASSSDDDRAEPEPAAPQP
ncbi:MAG: hypothetical protein DRQ55_04480 [Planctomycetota bacterium]|nr:MAG: hypothetical protein DRQ55_04480 [Planctomycetota bacterium]